MIFSAKDYQTRDQLEDAIRNRIGHTVDPKPRHSIEGTKAELSKLHLSKISTIWGINCKEIDPEMTKSKASISKKGLNMPTEDE